MSPSGAAWYHHFWPWFILGLLATSIVASLATVVIAVRHADVEIPRTPALRVDSESGIGAPPADAAPFPSERGREAR